MTTFEVVISACAVAIALPTLYDWVQFQLELHARNKEERGGG